MADASSAFGDWVRRRRQALDLTQVELAGRVGCAVTTIQRIEAGVRRPSRQMAERLADQLDVPADDRAAFIQVARADLAASAAPGSFASPLPSGTVTFLFTDIAGSSRLWEQHPQAMQAALARHDALLRTTIMDHGGVVFKTAG